MRKFVLSFVVLMLVAVVILSASSTSLFMRSGEDVSVIMQPAPAPMEKGKRTVDLMADDAYYISKGDSTLFILVGNFAAHHNGAVIMADSAVRYSNQSFECFGNVLINQNNTFVYGNRAEYNNQSCDATVYSDLVKIVDGDATMYTYNCRYNTESEIGEFWGGCFVDKGDNHMESQRGYYNTKTHDITAVERVEMRDDRYQMRGDSVIFNTETENAQYFTNSNIWSDNDEYLYADAGTYTKERDFHHLTRNAYILSPEREVWSDSIEYYRSEGHIIGRRNIQVDDTEQKIMGFADYGEWWDEPGNALFTGRPSMINYDTQQTDTIFLSADTLWMYTIPVLPPEVAVDSTNIGRDSSVLEEQGMVSDSMAHDENLDQTRDMSREERRAEREERREERKAEREERREEKREGKREERREDKGAMRDERPQSDTMRENEPQKMDERPQQDVDKGSARTQSERVDPTKRDGARMQDADMGAARTQSERVDPTKRDDVRMHGDPVNQMDASRDMNMSNDDAHVAAVVGSEPSREEGDVAHLQDSIVQSDMVETALVQDSLAQDSLLQDSLKMLSPKQKRKIEKRRQRDSIKLARAMARDSVRAIKRAKKDSIRAVRDSLLNIKIDSIIAKRKERNARLADEEKAHMERVKQRVQEHQRRKIERAKARAARRGKVYTGPELEDLISDTIPSDSLAVAAQDSIAMSSGAGVRDSLSMSADSLARDSVTLPPPFPADSTYKMIKAYRNVKMYRADSQIVCDSMVILNTDSIVRLYQKPVLWNESNQVTSDSMKIYTRKQKIEKIHFMGNPLMGGEIDTMYYNQVKGKDMTAIFDNGKVVRNDVEGNAQTIYFMQEEDTPDVTGLMYIESASISFYFDEGTICQIVYKQNPAYVLYPLALIPETQERRLPDFEWFYDMRPSRHSVMIRTIRPSQREGGKSQDRPRFRITERINYDRRRLTENGEWVDRVDVLPPYIIEWRNSRPSYKQRQR